GRDPPAPAPDHGNEDAAEAQRGGCDGRDGVAVHARILAGSGPGRERGNPHAMSVIGIVGGSGLYELEGLTDKKWQRVDSPFGRPSDDLLVGTLGEHEVVFLPRHGRGHKIPPHEIPYAANIDALKRAGVQQVISVSAVGSLRDDRPPGDFVVVDQFIDRTLRKPKTFFGTGLTAHVSVGHPTCRRMMKNLYATGKDLGLPIHEGGTYVVMEGPQFSTMAESQLHRSWN